MLHVRPYSSFEPPAPRCSLPLLFPLALSVGDARFLSASADQSPVLRLFLIDQYPSTTFGEMQL